MTRRNRLALDGLNFFLADVRDGLGPYLAIWLLVTHDWDAGSISAVMFVAGIATLVFQTPAGALIDTVRWKRGAIAGGAVIVALAAVAMVAVPSFAVVFGSQIVLGSAAAVFAPALAAVTLGLTGPAAYGARACREGLSQVLRGRRQADRRPARFLHRRPRRHRGLAASHARYRSLSTILSDPRMIAPGP